MNDFEKIAKQETNEKTALLLMLGIISEKLSEIISLLKNQKERDEKHVSAVCILTPEDYD